MPGESRRDAIREILSQKAVGSQGALRRHLAARGIRVAQATLSRDLVRLGVRRIAGAGGPLYLVDGDGALPIDPLKRMVDAIDSNAAMVVVRTKAGAASPVARALDEARLPDVLGTLAGDDTVFVAPASARGGRALARRLRQLFGVG
jgi:transcriptional regulator of arginine metabolism